MKVIVCKGNLYVSELDNKEEIILHSDMEIASMDDTLSLNTVKEAIAFCDTKKELTKFSDK